MRWSRRRRRLCCESLCVCEREAVSEQEEEAVERKGSDGS
jgi:hypothetical protein